MAVSREETRTLGEGDRATRHGGPRGHQCPGRSFLLFFFPLVIHAIVTGFAATGLSDWLPTKKAAKGKQRKAGGGYFFFFLLFPAPLLRLCFFCLFVSLFSWLTGWFLLCVFVLRGLKAQKQQSSEGGGRRRGGKRDKERDYLSLPLCVCFCLSSFFWDLVIVCSCNATNPAWFPKKKEKPRREARACPEQAGRPARASKENTSQVSGVYRRPKAGKGGRGGGGGKEKEEKGQLIAQRKLFFFWFLLLLLLGHNPNKIRRTKTKDGGRWAASRWGRPAPGTPGRGCPKSSGES